MKLITITPRAEETMGYCARASSPKNQKRMEAGELSAAGLLKWCADKGHWSVFEMANAVFEIKTTRAISAQILRHRSFSFQEFSQRYAVVDTKDIETPELRMASTKNRQSSTELSIDPAHRGLVMDAIRQAIQSYNALIADGVATETARMVLPMCTPTTLYMNGTIRSWVHYLALRCSEDTQKEHRLVAEEIRSILALELPTCAEAFGW